MQLSAASALALVTLLASQADARVVARQALTADAVVQALKGASLNNLANAFQANPEVVQDVLNSPGPKLLLAPDDNAIAAYPAWTTGDKELFQSTLLMHVLNGTFDLSQLTDSPLHTVGHSFLTNPKYSSLPGGNGAAVALTDSQDERFVQEAVNTNAFVSGQPVVLGGLTVQPIQRGLTVPGNTSSTLKFIGKYDALITAVTAANLAETIDNMRGSTLFAPSTEALERFQNGQEIPAEQLPIVLKQHVIANRAVYSPLLEGQGTLVNAAGQDVIFNREQNTVSVGNSTARVVQYDVMTKGGVIHLIDSVLASTANDEARAAQAADSAAKSANSYVAGPITATNAASSQGQSPPTCDGCRPAEGTTNDATNGNGAAPGTPGGAGSATAGVTGTDGKGGTTLGAAGLYSGAAGVAAGAAGAGAGGETGAGAGGASAGAGASGTAGANGSNGSGSATNTAAGAGATGTGGSRDGAAALGVPSVLALTVAALSAIFAL